MAEVMRAASVASRRTSSSSTSSGDKPAQASGDATKLNVGLSLGLSQLKAVQKWKKRSVKKQVDYVVVKGGSSYDEVCSEACNAFFIVSHVYCTRS